MTMTTKEEIIKIFNDCQTETELVSDQSTKLLKIYKKIKYDEFMTIFENIVLHILLSTHQCLPAQIMTELCVNFSLSFKERRKSTNIIYNRVLTRLINLCFEHYGDKKFNVRFRCCQLLNKIFNLFSDDTELEDDIMSQMLLCMLERLNDVKPVIRIEATRALARLQDGNNTDCPIIEAYLHMIQHDPNSTVRLTVLESIAILPTTISFIVDRTMDTSILVRKTAFNIVGVRVGMLMLTIQQRLDLLRYGLADSSEQVRDACASCMLVVGWLGLFGGDVIAMLEHLDVESDLDMVEMALKWIFKDKCDSFADNRFLKLVGNEQHLVDPTQLTAEVVVYWQTLISFLTASGHNLYLEDILPNVLDYVEYIKLIVKSWEDVSIDRVLTREFIISRLLTILTFFDLTDNIWRREVQNLLLGLMVDPKIEHSLTHVVTIYYSILSGNEIEGEKSIIDVIADIRGAQNINQEELCLAANLDNDELNYLKLNLAQLKVQRLQLCNEIWDLHESQERDKALDVNARLHKIEDNIKNIEGLMNPPTMDVETVEMESIAVLRRSLTIFVEFMRNSPKMRSPVSTILSLVDNLILPSLQNSDVKIRALAVKSLCFCCLNSRLIAENHSYLFIRAVQIDVNDVRSCAVMSINDLVLCYGFDIFAMQHSLKQRKFEEEEAVHKIVDQSVSPESIISLYLRIWDSEEEADEMREMIPFSLVKILISGRIHSSDLVLRLFNYYFDPSNSLSRNNSILACFFPIFGFLSFDNKILIEEVFIPVIKNLLIQSNDVDVSTAVSYMARLIGPSKDDAKSFSSLHAILVVRLLNDVLEYPDNLEILCILKNISLSDISLSELRSIHILIEKVYSFGHNKRSLKYLHVFKNTVDLMINRMVGEESTSNISSHTLVNPVVVLANE